MVLPSWCQKCVGCEINENEGGAGGDGGERAAIVHEKGNQVHPLTDPDMVLGWSCVDLVRQAGG